MTSISRYFAISSAIIAFLVISATTIIYRNKAIYDLVEIAELQNIVLARALSNSTWSLFSHNLTVIDGLSPDSLKAASETKELDSMFSDMIEDLPVLKIKIYRPDGLTLYSTEAGQIGELHGHDDAYFSAAHEGVAQSKLTYRDQFSAISGEVFDRDIVETYVPIYNDEKTEIGVFELYSDVTPVKEKIDETTIFMIAGMAVSFVVLYGLLNLVVMRRMMSPLHTASIQASEISPRNPETRLSLDGMPVEIAPLIRAVNEALDRLNTALESQRRFVVDAAHELLTPISVLQARVDTLDDHSSVEELRREINSLSEIIGQLFDLAALETYDIPKDLKADFRGACISVTDSLEPMARSENKSIVLKVPDEAVLIRGLDRMILSVVRNLVSNALAHTPQGKSVTVELTPEGVLTVADEGPGISPEDREAVFERFWRRTRSNRAGAGIGLAIVKQAADAFGGTVEVSDAPGGGALFRVEFQRVS